MTFLSLLVISIFIVGQSVHVNRPSPHNLLLTVSGDASRFFDPEETDVVELVKAQTSALTVQRMNLEDGQVQFRATVATKEAGEAKSLLSELQKKLPSFDISYVNLDNML